MMTPTERIIFYSEKATVKEKAEVCQRAFGFIASCKRYFDAKEILERMKKNDVEARVETIHDELHNVVLV